MGGGLLQMVAYGLHDTMLTGNPQISFLKLYIENIRIFIKEYRTNAQWRFNSK